MTTSILLQDAYKETRLVYRLTDNLVLACTVMEQICRRNGYTYDEAETVAYCMGIDLREIV